MASTTLPRRPGQSPTTTRPGSPTACTQRRSPGRIQGACPSFRVSAASQTSHLQIFPLEQGHAQAFGIRLWNHVHHPAVWQLGSALLRYLPIQQPWLHRRRLGHEAQHHFCIHPTRCLRYRFPGCRLMGPPSSLPMWSRNHDWLLCDYGGPQRQVPESVQQSCKHLWRHMYLCHPECWWTRTIVLDLRIGNLSNALSRQRRQHLTSFSADCSPHSESDLACHVCQSIT